MAARFCGVTHRAHAQRVAAAGSDSNALPAGGAWPIHVVCLPLRSVVCKPRPSGADTEVRPPATRVVLAVAGS